MYKGKLILVAAGLFLLNISINVYAYDNHDFQVWNTDSVEFKPAKNVKGVFEQEFRWGDNASQFFYQHYDIGFFYSFNQYLSAGGGYRYVSEIKNGEFRPENEPYLCAFLNFDKYGFNLESRNRLEYRDFSYQADSWRYRNKFTLKSPWKFTFLKIQPIVGDEVFVAFGAGTSQFNENRFFPGFGINLTRNLRTELFYMLQIKKASDTWVSANILYAKVKFSF